MNCILNGHHLCYRIGRIGRIGPIDRTGRMGDVGRIGLLALFLAIFLSAGISVRGQTPVPGMFTVDYKLLVALHPSMANFDLVLGRHLRTDIPFQDQEGMAKLSREINALSVKARAEADKIQKDIDKLLLQKADLENRMSHNVVEFHQEKGTLTGASTQKIQGQKLGEVAQRVAALHEQQNKVWDDVMNPLYLPRPQSHQLVEKALAEIDSFLDEASRSHGGAMIIDRDFVRVQVPSTSIPQAHTTGADPLSIRLFQSLLQTDLVGKVPEFYLKNPDLQRYAGTMRQQMEQSFDRNVAAQISKAPLFETVLGMRGGLFLTGAERADLTRSILTQIYQKHKIKTDVAQRILALVP